ncbi:MAG: hypothetical protein WAV28_04790 [Sedimentisphaerales bacterium]
MPVEPTLGGDAGESLSDGLGRLWRYGLAKLETGAHSTQDLHCGLGRLPPLMDDSHLVAGRIDNEGIVVVSHGGVTPGPLGPAFPAVAPWARRARLQSAPGGRPEGYGCPLASRQRSRFPLQ